MNLTQTLVVQSLRLNQKSEALIANNLANLETPGFKARELSFQGALAAALGSGPGAVAHVRGKIVALPLNVRADGSSVSLTGQMTALAGAQLQYDLAVQAFNHERTETQIVTEGKAL